MTTQLKEAIETAGGVAAVAAHFEISPVSVYEWIKRGYVPAEKCPDIEKFSGGKVRCEQLNDRVDWSYIRAADAPTHRAAAPEPPDRDRRNLPSAKGIMSVTTEQPVVYERKK